MFKETFVVQSNQTKDIQLKNIRYNSIFRWPAKETYSGAFVNPYAMIEKTGNLVYKTEQFFLWNITLGELNLWNLQNLLMQKNVIDHENCMDFSGTTVITNYTERNSRCLPWDTD